MNKQTYTAPQANTIISTIYADAHKVIANAKGGDRRERALAKQRVREALQAMRALYTEHADLSKSARIVLDKLKKPHTRGELSKALAMPYPTVRLAIEVLRGRKLIYVKTHKTEGTGRFAEVLLVGDKPDAKPPKAVRNGV